MPKPARQPSIFLAHGDPMNALRDNDFTRSISATAAALPEKPRAILVVSAHWESRGTLVCSASLPETIHDFGGFPDELYAVRYPAPGAPELARKAARLVTGARDTLEWGLDHGAWSVLRHAFPDADVPAFQVSIDALASLPRQLEIGRALAPLRDEGVLIVGSGNIVHNLARISWGGKPFPSGQTCMPCRWMPSGASPQRSGISRSDRSDGWTPLLVEDQRFSISQARVSQLRRYYERAWHIFQDEAPGKTA